MEDNTNQYDKRVHISVNGVLTVNCVITRALHEVHHFAEAMGFMVGGIMAVWAADFERKMHRHHLKKLLDKLEKEDNEPKGQCGYYHDMAHED